MELNIFSAAFQIFDFLLRLETCSIDVSKNAVCHYFNECFSYKTKDKDVRSLYSLFSITPTSYRTKPSPRDLRWQVENIEILRVHCVLTTTHTIKALLLLAFRLESEMLQ